MTYGDSLITCVNLEFIASLRMCLSVIFLLLLFLKTFTTEIANEDEEKAFFFLNLVYHTRPQHFNFQGAFLSPPSHMFCNEIVSDIVKRYYT